MLINGVQALVGAAFSLGFLFGPSIGAAFSVWGKTEGVSSFTTFQYPAMFALSLSLLNIILVTAVFRESLPHKQRVCVSASISVCRCDVDIS